MVKESEYLTKLLYLERTCVYLFLLSYGHQTMLLRRAMAEKQEKAARLRTKQYKPLSVGVISKNDKRKKKLFTHPSFLIAPLKHSTNETHCWKESCKEIKWEKKNKTNKTFFSQRRFGQQPCEKRKPSIPLVCVRPGLSICAVSAVEKKYW